VYRQSRTVRDVLGRSRDWGYLPKVDFWIILKPMSTNKLVCKASRLLGLTSRPYQRKHRRVKGDFKVTLTAPCGELEVRGVDASAKGIGVISLQPLHIGTVVFVNLSGLNLVTSATVRHCGPREDSTFAVGLEFRDKLRPDRLEVHGWSYRLVLHETREAWDATSEYISDTPAEGRYN
jgi:hypothetical protein